MSIKFNTPTARVEASFKQLSVSAQTLNNASDELGKAVQLLDGALKKLGLGISAWVEISGNDDGHDYWSRDLGYARINGKWCIAIRDVKGNHQHPDHEHEESWAFNEAPRWIRIEGIVRIPDLLEKLVKQAEDTTKKLHARTLQALELATIVSAVANNDSVSK